MTTNKKWKAKKKEARRAEARANSEQPATSSSAYATSDSGLATPTKPLLAVTSSILRARARAPDPDPSLQQASALHSSKDVCAKCGANTDAATATTCDRCKVTVYCSEKHAAAHAKHHRAACMVFQADAAAADTSAPVTDMVHAALLRLLYHPLRAVQSMQALLHVLDNRGGRYTEGDLRDVPALPRLRGLMHRHPMLRRGTLRDTPLESCKLATTLLLMLCAQLTDGTAHLMQSAGWLSQSKGAFSSSDLKCPNAAEKTFRAAVTRAVERMRVWDWDAGASKASRRGICIGVSVTDCAVFRMPWMNGCAHHFALVLAAVATSASGGTSQETSFVGRLYQAYGPPDIGYSLRQNTYVGGGSHSMSEGEVWEYVQAFEKMHCCRTWGQARHQYARVFGAEPKLPSDYPLELHVYTRTSEFSEESLKCMCRVHAELLDVPYAALP